MPSQYDAIKRSLVKRSGGSTEDAAIKTRASKIYVARGSGGSRASRAKQLHADRKTGR